MTVLLVEDDAEKTRRILDFLSQRYSGETVVVVRSFHAALDALIAEASNYWCVLLDMSMPNFDTGAEDLDGVPESFAGRDLLAQMKLRSINVPTIVITMFDKFGEGDSEMSVSDLTSVLEKSYPLIFVGLVQYSQVKDGWKPALEKLMSRAKR